MLRYPRFARVANCIAALLFAAGVIIGLAWLVLLFFPPTGHDISRRDLTLLSFAWLVSCGMSAALWRFSGAKRRLGPTNRPANASVKRSAGLAHILPSRRSAQDEKTSGDTSSDTDLLSLSIVELPMIERSLATPAHDKPSTWTVGLLRELEWKRFEMLCIGLFKSVGFAVEPESLGPLGGLILKMHRKDLPGEMTIAYCRASGAIPIDADDLRDARAILSNENAARGFYLTPGVFTSAAVDMARGTGIRLINGETLVRRLRALPYQQKYPLLKLATDGDYRIPSCEICSSKMTLCGRDRRTVWACSAYPDCRHRMISEQRAA